MNSINNRIISQSTHSEWDLYGEIYEMDTYFEFINVLNDADERDTIVININSPGGNVDIGFMILKAIKSSKAVVIARIVWPSASMAALIACACDTIIFEENTHLMFHTFSHGSYGKSGDVLQHTQKITECFISEFKKVIVPFISPKEFKRIQDGKDFYINFNDKDLKTRIERHFDLVITEDDLKCA